VTDTAQILVLATTNPGKVAEFRTLLTPVLDGLRVRLATPTDLGMTLAPIEETGETFAENAILKAVALAKATGQSALADDSGLCVDALDGAPGLYSARWAGRDISDTERTSLLLDKLSGIPAHDRTARFVCAAALATPAGEVSVTEGICEGVIAESISGSFGFGYDPAFLIPSLGATMAELTPERKNEISHRAQALKLLGPPLRALFVVSE
jgi:XTP/dITP diphosphohydrolase